MMENKKVSKNNGEKNQLGQFIPLHYHFQMLSDTHRTEYFKNAIEQVVKPHHKVVELGTGTGIMSFFAAQQGAMVWAVEYNPSLVEASSKFLTENGVDDRVTVVEADAGSWLPPEPVDVVICEMLHSALLREKQVQVIAAFRKAHLKRFGTIPIMIPTATLLGVQPVQQQYHFYGYHAPIPLFQSPYFTAEDCQSDIEPVVYKTIDYDNAIEESYYSQVDFSFTEKGEVNALRFITKNLLSFDTHNGQTVDWHSQHLVIPLPASLSIQEGQTLRVQFDYIPGDSIETLTENVKIEVI